MTNIEKLDDFLEQLGISKVRLAKYLDVSRQMLYNYLKVDDINTWPKEKRMKLFQLFNVKTFEEVYNIKVTTDYVKEIETRLNIVSRKSVVGDSGLELKGLNKEEQEILNNIFFLLKEKFIDDDDSDSNDTYNLCRYLYYFLQSTDTSKELKYILGYISKATGFIKADEYVFDEEQQFIFESILYSAMTLYSNGGASKSKVADSHRRFVEEIEHKNIERLSRTQELNTAKVQALAELGYSEINEQNASEVFEKIAEIQSRKLA